MQFRKIPQVHFYRISMCMSDIEKDSTIFFYRAFLSSSAQSRRIGTRDRSFSRRILNSEISQFSHTNIACTTLSSNNQDLAEKR